MESITNPFKAAANKCDQRKKTSVTTSKFQGGDIHAAAVIGDNEPVFPKYLRLVAAPAA